MVLFFNYSCKFINFITFNLNNLKTELSEYYKSLKPFVLQMPFGTYFFFEKFIVSEINEGVHFEWNMAEKLALEVFKYYGKDAKLGFISNRVNRHSVDPQN